MDYIFLQIFTAVGVFLALISFSYLPYCIIQYRARKQSSLSRRKATTSAGIPVLSLCNCFAAGVFLATCFLGMVPHVREHVAEWNEAQRRQRPQMAVENHSVSPTSADSAHGSHSKNGPPWTEILLMGGFLMILLMEELISACQHYCRCCRRRQADYHHGVTGSRPLPIASAEDEPLMSEEDELGSNHVQLGNGSKPVPDSPVNAVRMRDMDGHTRIRGSNSVNHEHHHHHVDAGMLLGEGTRSLSWRSVALLFGLGIHGVFEGVALGLQDKREALFSLLFGVMSHEALCAIAFGINLAGHRVSAGVAFLTAVLFSLSIPFGMMAGFVVNRQKTGTGAGEVVRIALEGLAAGTFVYVSFMDMLAHELAHGHDEHGQEGPGARWRLAKVLCVSAGFLLFLGLTFVA